METEINLKELKGAPLSVLFFLWMHGERVMSVAELAEATGFSDKPVKKGLMRLAELGYVAEIRKGRYQLAGDEYQLPLSWDEKILPFGNSPKKSGVSPDIESRIERLEAAVFRGLPASEAEAGALYCCRERSVVSDRKDDELHDGNFTGKFGISPSVSGDSPLIEIEDGNGNWTVIEDEERFSGNFAEKFGKSPEGFVSGGTVPDRDSPREVPELGETPKETGKTPKNTGENPIPLIKNINSPEKEEVSKQADPDNYLLVDKCVDSCKLTCAGEKSGEIPEKVRGIWNAALEQMKGSMERTMYETLLGKADVIGFADGHYTVRSANTMLKDWADQRIRGTLEKILSSMSGTSVSVSFVVEPEGPVGDSPVKGLSPDESPDLYPEEEYLLEGEGELVDICNDYLVEPVGICYSLDELRELVAMDPDPRVLRFALPMAERFDHAVTWCKLPFERMKARLLAKMMIGGDAARDLVTDDNVSLELIRKICEELDTANSDKYRGYAIKRIKDLARNGYGDGRM